MANDSKFLFGSGFKDGFFETKKTEKKKNGDIEAMDLPVLNSSTAVKFKGEAFNSNLFTDNDKIDDKKDIIGLREIDSDRPIEDIVKEAYQKISDTDEAEPFYAPLPENVKEAEETKEVIKEEAKEAVKEEIKAEIKEETPPPVTFTEEELEEAKKIALQEGYEKAKNEFERGLEKQLSITLDAINGQMARISAEREKAIDEIKKGSLDVALAVCKKALPTLETKYSFLEVTKTISDVIDIIKEEARVEITVNPVISEKVKEKINKIKTDMNISGNFVVLSDNNVKINDCKINFTNGNIEKNTNEVMAKIDDIIKTYRTAIEKKTV